MCIRIFARGERVILRNCKFRRARGKKIKDIHEYDSVIDNIVAAEQRGQINNDQVIELNKLIGEFEKQKKQRVDKKRDVN